MSDEPHTFQSEETLALQMILLMLIHYHTYSTLMTVIIIMAKRDSLLDFNDNQL